MPGASIPYAVVVDYRPSCGGGSCAACGDALDLDAVESGGVWYCSPACAQGLPVERRRTPRVPEVRLYNRPRRFFGRRAPKELRRPS